MYSCYFFLTLYFIESFGAQKTNTNFLRQYQGPVNLLHEHYPSNPSQRFLESNQINRTDDYNDRSGGFAKLRSSMHVVHATETTFSDDEKVVFKIHQPREDPKLYYQSEAYLKEVKGQNVNQEVASIYPGWEVIRADEKYRIPKHLLRSSEQNRITKSKLCIRCPHDRTLLAKVGADKVILQSPVLSTCSGRKAPRSVRLVHMYGPKFGTLLQHGSYILVGRLMHKNETLQLCKIQVHVIIQSCPTPKYLIPYCTDKHAPCNFTCRNKGMELQGSSALVCGEDMQWEGQLPVCRGRNRCKPLPPPDVGTISCRSTTSEYSLGLNEGSRCRIRCPIGWQWFPKAVSMCRRGGWTNELTCQPKKSILR